MLQNGAEDGNALMHGAMSLGTGTLSSAAPSEIMKVAARFLDMIRHLSWAYLWRNSQTPMMVVENIDAS